MRTTAIVFLCALAAALLLTPLVRRLAHRLGAIDHALSSRKVHGRPVPRLGGLAIVFAFYAPLAGLALTDSSVGRLFLADRTQALALFLGGLVIAGLGIYDDVRGAGARSKLLVEFAVAGLLYAAGYRIDVVSLPLLAPIALGWLSLPVTLLWVAGVINAVNLIDGLDGLAAGVGFVAAATTCVLAALGGNPLMMLFAASLGGAVLGFLRYNFNPASIFMGDTGSLFLGFVLAATSIQTHHKSSTAVALLAAVLVLGLPIADTLLSMCRRALRGAPVFCADREHIHHRLLDSGLGHRGAVLVLYAVSMLLSAGALVLAVAKGALVPVVLVALLVAGYLGLRRIGYFRFERAATLLEERRRNLVVLGSIRRTGSKLRRARQWSEVWPSVRHGAHLLGAEGVELRIATPADGDAAAHFMSGPTGEGTVRARHTLATGAVASTLKLRWSDRPVLDRDTEIAVEILCDAVGKTLSRIHRRQSPPWEPWVASAAVKAPGAGADPGSSA